MSKNSADINKNELNSMLSTIKELLHSLDRELDKYDSYEKFFNKDLYMILSASVNVAQELNVSPNFIKKDYFQNIFKKYQKICYNLKEMLPHINNIIEEIEIEAKQDVMQSLYNLYLSIGKLIYVMNLINVEIINHINNFTFYKKYIYNMLYNRMKVLKTDTVTKEGLSLHTDIFRLDMCIHNFEFLQKLIDSLKSSLETYYYSMKDILQLKGIELKVIPYT
ncbi:hypothetical protein DEFDS_P004 (plasmid) [Deferribacter desulfuricans SSM1]|uniref:Uncharacterized protein n=1 Tax=Deferribacter desulfuricans (strain DSM 14783 / JCM 11476 / NBRC 101012 / SSM1) TaxID=639282 RepID=D3PEJ0_DEFDS|nr:hypothetical protein [Deferribacter desulfuricans]BAI81632.1 hypothetical protein DEFDS_P004 [Deferribacter desulfuricans SSM1]